MQQNQSGFTACGKSKASVIPSEARDLLFVLTLRRKQIPRAKFAFGMAIRSFFPQPVQPLKPLANQPIAPTGLAIAHKDPRSAVPPLDLRTGMFSETFALRCPQANSKTD